MARLLFCTHGVLLSLGQSRLVAVHASLTKTKHLRDILYMDFFHSSCYSSHSLGPVSIFTMGGDNYAPMMEKAVLQQPPPPLSRSPFPLLPHLPRLHSLCLVPAMTK